MFPTTEFLNQSTNTPYLDFPLYEEINGYSFEQILLICQSKPDLMVLESASVTGETTTGHSFICFDGFATFRGRENQFFWNEQELSLDNLFSFLQEKLSEFQQPNHEALPSLQGGAVGYISYEASHYLEKLPFVKNTTNLPDIYFRFFSNIIAFDHMRNKSWIIANGFPYTNREDRFKQAKEDLKQIKAFLEAPVNFSSLDLALDCSIKASIQSNFTAAGYEETVLKIQNHILQGDIFQANLTQQFQCELSKESNAFTLYKRLKKINPAPYLAYLSILGGHGALISASPEQFIQLRKQEVRTCPIKGTIKRVQDTAEDKALKEQLLKSEKDRAENIMIVDLMRNDLSKVCQPHSVIVKRLCSLETFATVHHLVSEITGQLKPGLDAVDLLQATFPPGSVTGAPKIKAMEIIAQFEQISRGPYCGLIGYLSFNGDMDSAVTIRTYSLEEQTLTFSAGGAIVLDSDPNAEYLESLTKAETLMKALNV